MTSLRGSLNASPLLARLPLWGILGLALFFRLSGITWGLPLKFAHIDESVVIHYSLRIVAGVVNPGFYDYPGFFLYLLAGLFQIGATIHGWVTGVGLDSLVRAYEAGDPNFFTLSARGLTVGFALLTIGLTYSIGVRRGRWGIGVGAATFLAVNALHIRSSHYGLIDVAAGFLTLVAMDKIIQFGLTQNVRDGAIAAFFVGLGAATKYYPGILLIPLVLLPFAEKHPHPVRRMSIIVGMSFLGLFIGSPFTVLSVGEFWARFNHLAPKIVGLPTAHSQPFLPTIANLWRHAGPVIMVVGGMGVGYSFWEKGAWRILGILWLTLFIFLGLWTLQAPHYGLALYPPLFLFAFHMVDAIPWRRPLLGFLLAGALLPIALPSAVNEIRYLQRPDTRLQAVDWVRRHIPPGSKILRFSHTPDFKRSDPYQVVVDFKDERLVRMNQSPEELQRGIQAMREFDFIIISDVDPRVGGSSSFIDQSFSLMQRFSDPPSSGYHNPVVSIYSCRKNVPLAPLKDPLL